MTEQQISFIIGAVIVWIGWIIGVISVKYLRDKDA